MSKFSRNLKKIQIGKKVEKVRTKFWVNFTLGSTELNKICEILEQILKRLEFLLINSLMKHNIKKLKHEITDNN